MRRNWPLVVELELQIHQIIQKWNFVSCFGSVEVGHSSLHPLSSGQKFWIKMSPFAVLRPDMSIFCWIFEILVNLLSPTLHPKSGTGSPIKLKKLQPIIYYLNGVSTTFRGKRYNNIWCMYFIYSPVEINTSSILLRTQDSVFGTQNLQTICIRRTQLVEREKQTQVHTHSQVFTTIQAYANHNKRHYWMNMLLSFQNNTTSLQKNQSFSQSYKRLFEKL